MPIIQNELAASGFDWDAGNLEKCQKHGVSVEEIEGLFAGPLTILTDTDHSLSEERLLAIGRTWGGRHVFLAFTLRQSDGQTLVRPISARFMHRKEVEHYEEENPDLED